MLKINSLFGSLEINSDYLNEYNHVSIADPQTFNKRKVLIQAIENYFSLLEKGKQVDQKTIEKAFKSLQELKKTF